MQKSETFVTPIQPVRPSYIPNSSYKKKPTLSPEHTEFLRNLKQIEYQNCTKQNHYGQLKSRICIDNNCLSNQEPQTKQKYSLICCICQENDHKDHHTLPVKHFLESFYNKISNEGQQSRTKSQSEGIPNQQGIPRQKDIFNPLYYTYQIDERKILFVKKLREKAQQIVDAFRQLEVVGLRYYDLIGDQILKVLKIKENLKECLLNQVQGQSGISKQHNLNKQQGNKKNKDQRKGKNSGIEDFVKYSLQFVNFDDQYGFSLKDQLERLIRDTNQRDAKMNIFSNSIIKQVKTEVKKIFELYQKSTKLLKAINPKFEWDPINKPISMVINGLKITQQSAQSGGQRFALMRPIFKSITSKKPIAWAFKIIKNVGWVGVGMCLQKKVAFQKNYSFSYTSIGHGSYLISFNGYSWSHSTGTDNSMHKVFTFTAGDVVNICYDKQAKKIKFCKVISGISGSYAKYSMSVEDAPITDSYCPCVNLCSVGDSVQIVQNMEKIDWGNGF